MERQALSGRLVELPLAFRSSGIDGRGTCRVLGFRVGGGLRELRMLQFRVVGGGVLFL